MSIDGLKSFIASRRTCLFCVLLAAATFVVYWQVSGFEFINYDDPVVILQNPHVLGGLSWAGLRWALTTSWFDYWHPLPWLSHMLDCELFGVDAGWHHLANLGYHVANTLLLFVVLRRMTRAFWRSAMVATLFALHPLNVQSVAWITERKDVLSAFFFFLTLWAYARYTEVQIPKSKFQPHVSRITHHASIFYLLSLLFFACGLMSKPTVVTLPFVLLLLDYWPLQRLSFPTLHLSSTPPLRLVLEKLPFFALTIGSCAIVWLHVRAAKNMAPTDAVPWSLRLANAPVSYVRYLWKMIWPVDLAVLYPMPDHWAGWQVGGAGVLLLICTVLALALIRRQPWLTIGWFWFLGMLVPAVTLVPVWGISMADRFTYLPLVGVFIALVWGGCELLGITGISQATVAHPAKSPPAVAPFRRALVIAWVVAPLILLTCAGSSWAQLRYWRNSEALWARALAVTTHNARAYHNYGFAFEQQGRLPEAIEQYQAAVRIQPDVYETQNNLGRTLYRLGQLREATNHLMYAVNLEPGDFRAQANLGGALAALGDWRGAREHYDAAMAAEPQNATIPADWGKALLAHNRSKEAVECFARALQLDPRSTEARLGYGFALAQAGAALAADGKFDEAAEQYRHALQLQPDLPEVLNNLAWLLATANDARVRNGSEAVRSAKRACELSQYQQAMFVGTLAAAYAEDGQFKEARVTAQKAIALAEASGQAELAARNRELLRLYEAGEPCRQ